MLDWTTRHCRRFMRLLTAQALLYTEMVTTGALVHGDAARHLARDADEGRTALQLGGSDPQALAACAAAGEAAGYAEINLNVGCPSDRVQSGRFGACLMAEPALVAACVAAMRERVTVPVTVKTRLGIDELDSWEFLADFVAHVRAGGCRTLILHARKAWLSGLSPRQNRELPPLMYDRVHRVKAEFPDLEVVVNGGIVTLEQAAAQLSAVDGVMIGREACQNPWLLACVDGRLYGAAPVALTRAGVVAAYRPYVARELAAGTRLPELVRPLLGLFQGQPGARAWRRLLSERSPRPGAGVEVLDAALAAVRSASLPA